VGKPQTLTPVSGPRFRRHRQPRARAAVVINALWADKDALIDRLRTEMAGRTSAADGSPP